MVRLYLPVSLRQNCNEQIQDHNLTEQGRSKEKEEYNSILNVLVQLLRLLHLATVPEEVHSPKVSQNEVVLIDKAGNPKLRYPIIALKWEDQNFVSCVAIDLWVYYSVNLEEIEA